LERLKTLGSDVADETLSQITSKIQRGSGRRIKRKRLTLIKKRKVYKKNSRKAQKGKKKYRKRRRSKKINLDFLK
jgi:hypothetical protein